MNKKYFQLKIKKKCVDSETKKILERFDVLNAKISIAKAMIRIRRINFCFCLSLIKTGNFRSVSVQYRNNFVNFVTNAKSNRNSKVVTP